MISLIIFDAKGYAGKVILANGHYLQQTRECTNQSSK